MSNELVEWVQLMVQAKEAGLTPEEVRKFIEENKEATSYGN